MPPEHVSEQRVYARTVDGRRWLLKDLLLEEVAEEIELGAKMLRLETGGYVLVSQVVAIELEWQRTLG